MGRNKPRLYLAIYDQPDNPKQYRFTLIVCPKHHDTNARTKHIKRYQITDIGPAGQDPWCRYEQTAISSFKEDPQILVLFRLGKIKSSMGQFETILSEVSITWKHGIIELQNGDVYYESWVRTVMAALEAKRGMAPPLPIWHEARTEAYNFVQEELATGRWSPGWKGETGVPLRYFGSGLTVYVE